MNTIEANLNFGQVEVKGYIGTGEILVVSPDTNNVRQGHELPGQR